MHDLDQGLERATAVNARGLGPVLVIVDQCHATDFHARTLIVGWAERRLHGVRPTECLNTNGSTVQLTAQHTVCSIFPSPLVGRARVGGVLQPLMRQPASPGVSPTPTLPTGGGRDTHDDSITCDGFNSMIWLNGGPRATVASRPTLRVANSGRKYRSITCSQRNSSSNRRRPASPIRSRRAGSSSSLAICRARSPGRQAQTAIP